MKLVSNNPASKAEQRYKEDTTVNMFLGKCLKDIGWNFQQLPRELMAFILQDSWEPLVQYLHKLFFGPSTTKEICVSTFSWLHYKVQSTSRRCFMSDWTKYAYCILSPYTVASGMNQLLPDGDDWHIMKSKNAKEFKLSAGKFMSIQTTMMPEDIPGLDSKRVDPTWRKAGVLSDERSIAAMAYLIEQEEHDWQYISAHWAGTQFFSNCVSV